MKSAVCIAPAAKRHVFLYGCAHHVIPHRRNFSGVQYKTGMRLSTSRSVFKCFRSQKACPRQTFCIHPGNTVLYPPLRGIILPDPWRAILLDNPQTCRLVGFSSTYRFIFQSVCQFLFKILFPLFHIVAMNRKYGDHRDQHDQCRQIPCAQPKEAMCKYIIQKSV